MGEHEISENLKELKKNRQWTPEQKAKYLETMRKKREKLGATPLSQPVYLAGELEVTQKADAKTEKDYERAKDKESSATERRIKELEEELAEKNKVIAKYASSQDPDEWKNLAIDHPFEVTIQATAGGGGMQPAKFWHNGQLFEFQRERPKIVPRYVLTECIDRTVYSSWEKIARDDGNVEMVKVEYHRFPYTARPVFTTKAA